MWLRFPLFPEIIKTTWESSPLATTTSQLHLKLNNLQQRNKEWSREQIGTIKSQISACRDFMAWIDKVKKVRTTTQLERWLIATIKQRHKTLAVLEEDLWRQRERTRWELQGDRNTKYFHALASNLKRANMITQIEHDGVLYSDHNTKSKAFFDFFVKLMGTPSPQMPHVHWRNLYRMEHNLQEMSAPITSQEIHKAIVQWPNNKSSGPDGFPGGFYKFFTSMLVTDLHEIFKRVMQNGDSIKPMNSSYIVLIPKKDSPIKPTDFRPISLLHGVHKIF